MGVTFDVKVGGEFACFSRPEFKVERMSYPVMTPSAARGVLEAIFWKPEFRWEVREIRVLKPIRQTTILRNEISDRQGGKPFFVEDKRQQRVSLILKDVEYLIRAEMALRHHADAPLMKYSEQFQRRIQRGQCHHTPYLGTREFAAWFEPASGDEIPVSLSLDLGVMLFDIARREEPGRPELEFYKHGRDGRHVARGYAEALFFRAELRSGVLTVPSEKYKELCTLEGKDA